MEGVPWDNRFAAVEVTSSLEMVGVSIHSACLGSKISQHSFNAFAHSSGYLRPRGQA